MKEFSVRALKWSCHSRDHINGSNMHCKDDNAFLSIEIRKCTFLALLKLPSCCYKSKTTNTIIYITYNTNLRVYKLRYNVAAHLPMILAPYNDKIKIWSAIHMLCGNLLLQYHHFWSTSFMKGVILTTSTFVPHICWPMIDPTSGCTHETKSKKCLNIVGRNHLPCEQQHHPERFPLQKLMWALEPQPAEYWQNTLNILT